MNNLEDDKEEILAVSDELSRFELHGAAQMINRLARQRDEAREECASYSNIIKYIRGTMIDGKKPVTK